MRIKILIGLVCLVISGSCTSQRANKASVDVPTIEYVTPEDYQVVATKKIQATNSEHTQELRIYKIQSALDASLMMNHYFGASDASIEGKFQDNIKQHTWNEVLLLDTKNKFTIVTDGTETDTDFFASIMVFDKENKNCFTEGHPLKAVIESDLLYRIGSMKEKDKDYKAVK